jgi:nitrogen regulatory protein PII
MLRVIATVRPHMLDPVCDAPSSLGCPVDSGEVSGFGRQKGHTEMYRGSEEGTSMVPKCVLVCVKPSMLMMLFTQLRQWQKQEKLVTGKSGYARVRAVQFELPKPVWWQATFP